MARPVKAKLCRVAGIDVLSFVAGEELYPNVTALWRAAGYPEWRTPDDYVESERGKRFLEAVASKAGVRPESLYRRDLDGMWMSWLVAMDYAGFISPDFKMAVYRLASDRARQLLDEYRRDDDWQDRRDRSKVARQSWTLQVSRIPDPPGRGKGFKFGRLSNITYRRFFGGSADELRKRIGIGKNASLRDHMPKSALSMLAFTEDIQAERLAVEESPTFSQAERLCERAAEITCRAADEIRRLAL